RDWSRQRTNVGTLGAVTVTDSELKRLGLVEWLDQIRSEAGLVRPPDREEKITIDTYCPRACPSATGPARHEPGGGFAATKAAVERSRQTRARPPSVLRVAKDVRRARACCFVETVRCGWAPRSGAEAGRRC